MAYRSYVHVFYMKKYIYIYTYKLNILSKISYIVIHLKFFNRLATNTNFTGKKPFCPLICSFFLFMSELEMASVKSFQNIAHFHTVYVHCFL